MTVRHRRRDWPRPYGLPGQPAGTAVAPGSVPVTAIILACNERVNIVRAVRSVGWCRQVVVVDSGSTDGTQDLARSAGATVWEETWRGFAGQREWAMRHPAVEHEWVFFLDADEWVTADLAAEISRRLGTEDCAGYALRWRMVFQGRWIAHCGWYAGSWQARLLDRRRSSFGAAEEYGERAAVAGEVLRLAGDIVDEDAKGLANWLHKHVRYAELEATRRRAATAPLRQLRTALRPKGASTRPLARTLAKEVLFPLVPAKPLALFLYMYVLRAGWRDGRAGLLFCLYHAWYQLTVGALANAAGPGRPAVQPDAPDQRAPVIPGPRRPTEIESVPSPFVEPARR